MSTHIHYRSATRLEFCVDAMLHGGYHEYQDIWTATSGERLKCACKIGNRSDFLFAYFSLHSLIHCMNHRWLNSVQNKVLIMLGHLADQNQFWLDNFTFYSDTILFLKTE